MRYEQGVVHQIWSQHYWINLGFHEETNIIHKVYDVHNAWKTKSHNKPKRILWSVNLTNAKQHPHHTCLVGIKHSSTWCASTLKTLQMYYVWFWETRLFLRLWAAERHVVWRHQSATTAGDEFERATRGWQKRKYNITLYVSIKRVNVYLYRLV